MKKFIFSLFILLYLLLAISVKAYTSYNVGDIITVKGEQYYVIDDSGENQEYVVALKENPLTVEDVNLYGGVGTENNHVNRYANESQSTAYDNNGFGSMAYYSSANCREDDNIYDISECFNDYKQSDVKYVVDNWSKSKFKDDELVEINGYKVRLITREELINNLGYSYSNVNTTVVSNNEYVPEWVWNENYHYWTMSSYEDYSFKVWYVCNDGSLSKTFAVYENKTNTVRPVINVKKDISPNIEVSNLKNDDSNNTTSKKMINVENTLLKKSLFITIIGLIFICSGITVYFVLKNNKGK